MSKAQKRQRKKTQREARIAELVRQHRARRRRKLLVNLTIVAVLAGVAAGMVLQARQDEEPAASDEPKAAECSTATPPKGNPAPVDREPEMAIDTARTYRATIETSCGTVTMELADDAAPRTVNSFVFLARRSFYDGLTFHRIVPGFALQGGDPKGDGTGGSGYRVTEAPPDGTKYVKGTVAMAKAGNEPAGTSGSQFFIVPGDKAQTLPPDYALLGKVTGGNEVLEKMERVRLEGEKPAKPLYIVKITVSES